MYTCKLYSTFCLSRPDIAIGNIIVKGYHCMHDDVILVSKFVQMVVANYQLQRLVWKTDPKSTVDLRICNKYSAFK